MNNIKKFKYLIRSEKMGLLILYSWFWTSKPYLKGWKKKREKILRVDRQMGLLAGLLNLKFEIWNSNFVNGIWVN